MRKGSLHVYIITPRTLEDYIGLLGGIGAYVMCLCKWASHLQWYSRKIGGWGVTIYACLLRDVLFRVGVFRRRSIF